MGKIRVYELARELNIESKLMLNTLKSVGISVASHQSMLSEEDVDKVKKALSGDSESSSNKPTAAKDSSGAVRVIRRRRAGAAETAADSTETKSDSTVEAVTKDPSSTLADESGSSSVSDKPVVTSEQSQAPQEEALTELAKTADQASNVNIAQESTQISDSDLNDGAVATKSTATESYSKKIKKKTSEPTATIVRRATPEEIEASRAAASQSFRGSKTRREDSRGTRFTGIGSSEDKPRGSTPNVDLAVPDPEVAARAADSKWRKSGKDRKDLEEDEDVITKKPAFTKSKRSTVNARSLLYEVDLEQDSDALDPIQSKTVYTPTSQFKKRDLRRRTDLKKTQLTTARAAYRMIRMGKEIQVGELAKELKIKSSEIIKKLMSQGMMVTVNQNIDFDTASLIASDYNYEVQSNLKTVTDLLSQHVDSDKAGLISKRPPIVTVMGHVDHGKTSILDVIRQSNVASKEAGGITQHIGAYTVDYNGKVISFIDTPGHEAFGSMRARGANVTDIVVLVVAADDGVMPQTIEAISHAREADVPIIVAINKIDKDNINLDRIYTQLTEHGIQAEEWGGDVQFVKVSALKQIGISDLLEAILLQSEMLDLDSKPALPGRGVVLEAHLDTGKGPIATVVVKEGTLRVGDYLVAGKEMGKIRIMTDFVGNPLESAPPSMPASIIGLSGVPQAGDLVYVVQDEKMAKEVLEIQRQQELAVTQVASSAQSLEDLFNKMKEQESFELPIIVKGDTQGSVEAVSEAILKLSTSKVKNRIVHKAVGGITESDISLAKTASAVVIAFNVRAPRSLDDEIEKLGIVVNYFSIIYDVVDAVKAVMTGKLPPILQEEVVGHAEVREAISVPKIGVIAGSAVLDGKIVRTASLRLIRDSVVVHEGKIGSLRRFKEDVKEVKSGYECGISIESCNDIRVGDVIEAYVVKEIADTL